MHRTTLDVCYSDSERTAAIARSVAREAGAIAGGRTHVSVEHTDTKIEVTIEAEDVVALRAGQTTWCTLLEVAERTTASAIEFDR